MKKIICSILLVCSTLLCALLLGACKEDDTVFTVSVPRNDEQCSEVYLINGIGQNVSLDQGKYEFKTYAKNGLSLSFRFKYKFDTSTLQIKANGVDLDLDIKSYGKDTGTYVVTKNVPIKENVTITLNELKLRQCSVSFVPAKVFEKGQSPLTAVSSPKYMDETTISVNNYQKTLSEAVADQSNSLKFEYGTKLKIYVKTNPINMCKGFGDFLFAGSQNESNGLFSKDNNGNMFLSDIEARLLQVGRDVMHNVVHDSLWRFEYDLDLDEDKVFCVNNFALTDSEFKVSFDKKINENNLFGICAKSSGKDATVNSFKYSDDFVIDVFEKKDTTALDNAILTINGVGLVPDGENVTREIVKNSGTANIYGQNFDIIRYCIKGNKKLTPESFGAPTNGIDGTFCVDITNVVGVENSFSFKVCKNDKIEEIGFSALETFTDKNVEPLNMSSYSEGSFFFEKSTELSPTYFFQIQLYIDFQFDYSGMKAKIFVNGKSNPIEFSYPIPGQFFENGGHVRLDFELKENLESVEIQFEGIVDKK
ncbi:MAG: hypothetical protein RR400_02350 [Clostridia bacterium]